MNKEAKARYQREWLEKNPDYYKNKKYKVDQHKREQRYLRDRIKRHNITIEVWVNLLESQNQVCAICGQQETRLGRKYLSIDHDHITDRVRGLLCHKCNMGLGLFEDNQELLQNAIDYLKRSQ